MLVTRNGTSGVRSLLLATTMALSLLMVACGGGGGSAVSPNPPPAPTPVPVNQAPTANAGPAQRVPVGVAAALDGSKSSDPDQDKLSYRWTVNERPTESRAGVTSDSLVSTSLTPDVAGRYVVGLEVSDGRLSSSTTVEVMANHAPSISVQAVPARLKLGDTLNLDASSSSDADGDKLSFSWIVEQSPEGSKALLGNANTSRPSFLPDRSGAYLLSVAAYDGLATSITRLSFKVNTPPVAAIAPQAEVIGLGTAFTLDAGTSSDADNDPLSYRWTLVSAPPGSTAQPVSLAGSRSFLIPDLTGTYTVGLRVSDALEESPVTQISFVAAAFPKLSVTSNFPLIPGEIMELDGSVSSDPAGRPLTYEWSVAATPEGATASIASPQSAKSNLVATTAGTYQIKLTVNNGWLSKSLVVPVEVDNRPTTRVKFPRYAKQGESVVFDASESSDPDGDALSFSWYLYIKPSSSKLDLSTYTTSRIEFIPDTPGLYGLGVQTKGRIAGPRTIAINKLRVGGTAPVAQIVTTESAAVGSRVTLDGRYSASEAGGLSYRWRLLSAPAFSATSLLQANASVASLDLDLAGSYTVSLIVNDGYADSEAATATITATASEPKRPSAPRITVPTAGLLAGKDADLSATAVDPAGLALQYSWRFADGTTAIGSTVRHRFGVAGQQEVAVTVTNTLGLSNSTSASLRVAEASPLTPGPACLGSKCAAPTASRYSGSGAGIWSLPNTGTNDISVNVDIDNVSPERKVILLLTNGSNNDSLGSPYFGTTPGAAIASSGMRKVLASQQGSGSTIAKPAATDPRDDGHNKIRQLNDKLLGDYVRAGTAQRTIQLKRKPLGAKPRAAPSLHSTRSWKGSIDETKPYETSAEASCRLQSGRNIVFWADSGALRNGSLSASTIDEFRNFFCGDDGAFARLTSLTGDVWGTHGDPDLIQDEPLQDVNVILGDPGADTGWGGYFSFGNAYLTSKYADSNQALAFVINVHSLDRMKLFLLSSLVHEAMHMANAYQRTVKRGLRHESWLEETTAMMAEDIVVAGLLKNSSGTPYNDISYSRIPSYMSFTGSFGYIGPSWGLGTYAAGGSFGAFLNRRYGIGLFKQLQDVCNDYTASQTSYRCVDQTIKTMGGQGFADEFARMGITLMAPLSAAETPPGYGYPMVMDGKFTLTAFDPAASPSFHLANSTKYYEEFQRTSMSYISDSVPSGSTRYRRNGAVVPAGSTLSVIIH